MKEKLQKVKRAMDNLSGWASHDDSCLHITSDKCECGYSKALNENITGLALIDSIIVGLDSPECEHEWNELLGAEKCNKCNEIWY